MILGFIRDALRVGRQAKEGIGGATAAREAYEAGAGLHGVVLAFSGTTGTAADDLASVALMDRVDSLARLVSSAAQLTEDLALELREWEAFLAALKGGSSLRAILERD